MMFVFCEQLIVGWVPLYPVESCTQSECILQLHSNKGLVKKNQYVFRKYKLSVRIHIKHCGTL